MSYSYGKLNIQNDAQYPFKGKITAPFFQGRVVGVATNNIITGAPFALIMAEGSGGAYPIANVWKKHSERTGELFYSIQFDTAELAAPVNCAGFVDAAKQEIEIVWKRQKLSEVQKSKPDSDFDFGGDVAATS